MKLAALISLILISVLCKSQNPNEATVSMKDYIDMQAELNRQLAQCRSEANRSISDVQFQNISDNVTKANAANEKRFDGVNEFRAQLKDQASTFVTWQALLGLIVGISGFLFGYANYTNRKKEREEKEREKDNVSGKAILSGDKVEVKK